MKYAVYCPECFKRGLKSKLNHEGSETICVQCGWKS